MSGGCKRAVRAIVALLLMAAGSPAAGAVVLVQSTLAIRIDGPLARTTLRLEVRNHGHDPAAFHCAVRVADSAAVFDLKAMIGEAPRTAAAVPDRAPAPGAAAEAPDPAVLRWRAPGLWQLSLADLPAGGARQVELSVVEMLPAEGNAIVYHSPRVQGQVADWHTFRVKVEAHCEGGVQSVGGIRAREIRLEGGGIQLDAQIKQGLEPLTLRVVPVKAVGNAVAWRHGDLRRVMGLLAVTDAAARLIAEPVDMVFVVDRSDSMTGFDRAADLAVRAGLARLREQDRFAILAVHETVQPFEKTWVPVSPANLQRAAEWLAAQKPGGGTDLAAALRMIDALHAAKERPTEVILITDGVDQISVAPRSPDQAAEIPQRLRFHAVSPVAMAEPLKRLALASGGSFAQCVTGPDLTRLVTMASDPAGRQPAVSTAEPQTGFVSLWDPQTRALLATATNLDQPIQPGLSVDGRHRGVGWTLDPATAIALEGEAAAAAETLWSFVQCRALHARLHGAGGDLDAWLDLARLSHARRLACPGMALVAVADEAALAARGIASDDRPLDPPGPLVQAQIDRALQRARRGNVDAARDLLRPVQGTADPVEVAWLRGMLGEYARLRTTLEATRRSDHGRRIEGCAHWAQALAAQGMEEEIPLSSGLMDAPVDPGEAALDRLLDKPIQFDGVPLQKVYDDLAKAAGLRPQVHWKSMRDLFTKPETPVTLEAAGITIRQTLTLVNDLQSAGLVGGNLVFRVRQGRLIIGNRQDVAKDTQVRVSNIAALVPAETSRFSGRLGQLGLQRHQAALQKWAQMRQAEEEQEDEPEAPARADHLFRAAAGGLGDSSSGNDAGSEGSGHPILAANEGLYDRAAVDHVEQTIQEIDPTSWRHKGGLIGHIDFYHGLLIVQQTLQNHRRVEQALAALRTRSKPPVMKLYRAPDLVDPIQAKALQSKVEKVSLDDVTLGNAFALVRKISGANIVVHWDALALAGVNPEDRISLSLADSTAEGLLQAIFDRFRFKENAGHKIDLMVREGVVFISTPDELCRYTSARIYDVRDLVLPGVLPVRGEDSFDGPQARSESLRTIILTTVDPKSWLSFRGSEGGTYQMGPLLIVKQDEAGHRKVAHLLSMIHDALAVRGANDPLRRDDVANWTETVWTPDGRLSGWAAALVARAASGQAPAGSSLTIRRAAGRTFAHIGGVWIDTKLTADRRVRSVAADAAAGQVPGGGAAAELANLGGPVIWTSDAGAWAIPADALNPQQESDR